MSVVVVAEPTTGEEADRCEKDMGGGVVSTGGFAAVVVADALGGVGARNVGIASAAVATGGDMPGNPGLPPIGGGGRGAPIIIPPIVGGGAKVGGPPPPAPPLALLLAMRNPPRSMPGGKPTPPLSRASCVSFCN